MNQTQQVDDATLLALHDAGKGCRQIADTLKTIGKSTVAKRLKHLSPRQSTEIFKGHRADIFAELGRKLANTLDAKAIKEMHPRDRFLALGLVYDKERIERGLSDNNARPMVVIQVKGDVQCTQITNPLPVDKAVSQSRNG